MKVFLLLMAILFPPALCAKNALLERVIEFQHSGELAAAEIELKNALQAEPGSAQVRFLLGEFYLTKNADLDAVKELRNALELGWPADEVLPSLARAYLKLDNFASLAELPLGNLSATGRASVLAVKANGELAQSRIAEARTLVDQALIIAPENLSAVLSNINILLAEENSEKAEQLIEGALLKHAHNAQVHWVHGNVVLASGRYQEARRAYIAATELSPLYLDARLAAIFTGIGLQEWDATSEEIIRLRVDHPRLAVSYYLSGLHEFYRGEFSRAAEFLTVAEPAVEGYPLINYYRALAKIHDQDFDVATIFIRQYVDAVPQDIRGRKVLSHLLLTQGGAEEARQVLAPLLVHDASDLLVLNATANAWLMSRDFDKAFTYFSTLAQYGGVETLQSALTRDGKNSPSAIQNLLQKMDPKHQELAKELRQIVSLLFDGHVEEAVTQTNAMCFRHPAEETCRFLLGRLNVVAGDLDSARKMFELNLRRSPDNPSGHLGLAIVALKAESVAVARTNYEAAYAIDSLNIETLLQYAAFEYQTGEPDNAEDFLKTASKYHPMDIRPRVALARMYLDSSRPRRVVNLFDKAASFEKSSIEVLRLRAEASFQMSDFEQAHSFLRQIVRMRGVLPFDYFALANVEGVLGNSQAMSSNLNNAIYLEPTLVPALELMARLAAQRGELVELNGYIANLEAFEQSPKSLIELKSIQGKIHSEYEQAREAVLAAHQNDPTPDSLMLLATRHFALGDTQATIDTLQSWLQDHSEELAVLLRLGEYFQRTGRMNEANEMFARVVHLDSSHTSALNNLAWNLREIDPTKALGYGERALLLEPENAAVLDTLAVLHRKQGDLHEAFALAARAVRISPEDGTVRYHKADIQLALGMRRRALVEYESAVFLGGLAPEYRSQALDTIASLKTLSGAEQTALRF